MNKYITTVIIAPMTIKSHAYPTRVPLIDDYNKDSDFIFVRASRWTWGLRYSPLVVHLPNDCNMKEKDVLDQFAYAVRKIEAERDKIEIFEDYMKYFNFNAFTLEYKINIDWDTPNDKLVLSY